MDYSFQKNDISLAQITEKVEISFQNLHSSLIEQEEQSTNVNQMFKVPLERSNTSNYSQHQQQQQIKSTEELEMERINNEKKAMQKFKDKSKKMYLKLRALKKQQSQLNNQEELTGIKKKVSFVQQLIKKSKLLNNSNCENKEQVMKDSDLQLKKLKRKKPFKKTLTISTPFEFRTQKRVRVDIAAEEKKMSEDQEVYEPLCLKVEKSFKLREYNQNQSNKDNAVGQPQMGALRKLTKPKSPLLHTEKRFQLRDDLSLASGREESSHNTSKQQEKDNGGQAFKAIPFNKKIFDQIDRLPQIEKRRQTDFYEFQLSKSNAKLSKKTKEEYVHEKENVVQYSQTFKARSVSKKFLEEPTFKPQTERKRITEQSPFQFKTEQRMRLRSNSKSDMSMNENNFEFKAREMPNYHFFEVKHSSPKKILFKEFKLSTHQRVEKLKRSNSHDELNENSDEKIAQSQFKALPMPDFENLKPKTCSKRQVKIDLKPFKLQTECRGTEKKIKFDEQLIKEQQQNLEQRRFKAQEIGFKVNDGFSQSNEKPQKSRPTPIQQVEFKLQTLNRSKSREQFKQILRQKEMEFQQQQIEQEEQRKREEEEEIKRLRNNMTFKAQPIKSYKAVPGVISDAKKLTIPVAPRLQTSSRALLKDELDVKFNE